MLPLECTFDEAQETGTLLHAAPKNRYEKLENRISKSCPRRATVVRLADLPIGELEALLRQKDAQTEGSPEASPSSPDPSASPESNLSGPLK